MIERRTSRGIRLVDRAGARAAALRAPLRRRRRPGGGAGRAGALQDRGRRLRLRARARRARADEPAAAHLDRARGARGRRARPTRAICDHLATLTAPDGGVPVALPTLEPYAARAVVGRSATEGTLLATALLYAPLSRHVDAPVAGAGRGVLLDARSTRSTRRTRTRSRRRSRSSTPRRTASGPRRAAERLGAARARAGARRPAARGLLARRDPPPARLRQAPGQPRPRAGSATRRSRPASTTSQAQQREDGGWPITWAVWTPAIEIEWSGLVTIAALKIAARLRARI